MDENSSKTLICIGDIHGFLDKMKSLWSNLESEMGKKKLHESIVVFLGDYCDKGPDTKGVLDWLISVKKSRPTGSTIFLAGNHDFAMASYLGCIPADNIPEFYNLDNTKDSNFTKGFFSHYVSEIGMHYMGRRWGGSTSYKPKSTFESYGVDFKYTMETREFFINAVPDEHKKFLKDLVWMYEIDLPHCDPKKIVCIHAGIGQNNVKEQLEAIKNRNIFEPNHYVDGINNGRMHFMSGRKEVLKTPEEFKDNLLLISGHHGRRFLSSNRIIMDVGGGKEKNPIEAIILPGRKIISSDS
jgi:hypothetical protein